MSNKSAEMSGRMVQSDVKSGNVVADANTRYAEIIQTVNAYAIVQPSDVITAFIADVNGLVGVYSKIAGSNSGSGTAPDGSGEGSNDGDDDRPVIE